MPEEGFRESDGYSRVLSVDEKSQIQALDRTQPGLPMKRGRAGTMTHDYIRNGTTTLFSRSSRQTLCWRGTDSNPRSPVRRMYANTEIAADREQWGRLEIVSEVPRNVFRAKYEPRTLSGGRFS
jgi:hypothetical protein